MYTLIPAVYRALLKSAVSGIVFGFIYILKIPRSRYFLYRSSPPPKKPNTVSASKICQTVSRGCVFRSQRPDCVAGEKCFGGAHSLPMSSRAAYRYVLARQVDVCKLTLQQIQRRAGRRSDVVSCAS